MEWQWDLLAFIIIHIFFKNKVMKETKIRSIKNIWTAATVFSQSNTYCCSGSEIVVKQIFNLDHKFYTSQKYVVCKSRVEIGQKFKEISLNLADFTDFL